MSRPRVAVIGTGIAGMAAAYFLKDDCDVVLYEKDQRPGGHTHTVTVKEDGRDVPIDTGFMVYNETTYPNLVKFFHALQIPVMDTSMSFSVQHVASRLEYCGTGIRGLFAQKANLFKPSFFKLLADINAFNQESPKILDGRFVDKGLARYVIDKGWGRDLLEKYLLPMAGAIWSTRPEKMREFPAETLVRFFKNHGLLGLTTHFQWKTVSGGSRVYRDKLLSCFPKSIRLGCGAKSIKRTDDGVWVSDTSNTGTTYDKVVIATHADEALSLLEAPTPLQTQLLSAFRYQKNQAMLHTDERVMPKTRSAWSSWNARLEADGHSSVIYWMNSLQKVSQTQNYFVSINDPGLVEPSRVLWRGEYEHPVYDLRAVEAQKRLPELNEGSSIVFCGSYFKYGFHEDAFCAGTDAASALLGKKVTL